MRTRNRNVDAMRKAKKDLIHHRGQQLRLRNVEAKIGISVRKEAKTE